MRSIDRTFALAVNLPVVNGSTYNLGRIDLDAAAGFSVHTVTTSGAAGSLALLQTNFEGTMPGLPFNPDLAANCANAPATPLSITANSSQVTSVSSSGSTPYSRWLILSFTASASGTLNLSASVRKYPS